MPLRLNNSRKQRLSMLACGGDNADSICASSKMSKPNCRRATAYRTITKAPTPVTNNTSNTKLSSGNNGNNSEKTKKKKNDKKKKIAGLRRTKKSSRAFLSVLSQPFAPWNAMEMVIGDFCPDWSHTVRSNIVQHLVCFLELKILTEEFATDAPLLAPTPLLAQAWQALVLDSKLYQQVIYDLQDFHERPHQMLHFSLERKDYKQKYGKTFMSAEDQQRLERTQILFQTYYGVPMLTSVDDIDTDLSLLTDTSTITDIMGLYISRCGGGSDKRGDPTDASRKKEIKADNNADKYISFPWCACPPFHPALWSNRSLEAVGDVLFCQPKDDESSSFTALQDDLEEDPTLDETEFDSLFTSEFLNTRLFLCRGGGGHNRCQSPAEFAW